MILVILVLGLLLAVVLYAARLCYRLVFYRANKGPQELYIVPPGRQYEMVAEQMLRNIWAVDHEPCESIGITASDGEQLAGHYFHVREGGPVLLFFHGYRGNGLREFASWHQLTRDLGINAIVADQRAHGDSGGHTVSFGIRERLDCLDWANYAAARFGAGTKLILAGVSMGASTVLMASELDLPASVAAIVADCPYASPGAIIRTVIKRIRLPRRLAYPLVVLGALIYGRFPLWKSSAVRAVKNTDIPILLIHGDDDRLVPWTMSQEIWNACKGKKQLEIFPGAGHALCCLVDGERYSMVVRGFLKKSGIPIK